VSLQITHGVLSLSNSFLAVFLQLPTPKTRLNSIPLLPSSYPGRLASRNSTLHFRLLDYCSLLFRPVKVKVKSYVTTDGQSASLSWWQAPIWGLRPDFYYCQTVAGLLTWNALSDERTGLPFTIAAGPRQRSRSWVRVPRDSCP
jgi:hypothetical protein